MKLRDLTAIIVYALQRDLIDQPVTTVLNSIENEATPEFPIQQVLELDFECAFDMIQSGYAGFGEYTKRVLRDF